jgi:hypothetical protein
MVRLQHRYPEIFIEVEELGLSMVEKI